MMIARNRYLEKIKKLMGNGLVKVVTGIRRCGKSFFLFKIFRDYLRSIGVADDQVVEVHLDEDDYESLRTARRIYIQSAFEMPDEEKRESERRSLMLTGDFFRKIIVTGGNGRMAVDEDGIFRVGVIPFLLDDTILGV